MSEPKITSPYPADATTAEQGNYPGSDQTGSDNA